MKRVAAPLFFSLLCRIRLESIPVDSFGRWGKGKGTGDASHWQPVESNGAAPLSFHFIAPPTAAARPLPLPLTCPLLLALCSLSLLCAAGQLTAAE